MSDLVELEKQEKSQITGPFEEPPPHNRVMYRPLEQRKRRIGTAAIALAAVLVSTLYVSVLILSAVTAIQKGGQDFGLFVAALALGNEIVKSPLVLTLAYASMLALKPVPVRQSQTLNVLLGVTFVPKS